VIVPNRAERSRARAHDLIVSGASAGGVEAISKLVAGLPPDLPSAVGAARLDC
jgi:chemotaxis response regulator CheB